MIFSTFNKKVLGVKMKFESAAPFVFYTIERKQWFWSEMRLLFCFFTLTCLETIIKWDIYEKLVWSTLCRPWRSRTTYTIQISYFLILLSCFCVFPFINLDIYKIQILHFAVFFFKGNCGKYQELKLVNNN